MKRIYYDGLRFTRDDRSGYYVNAKTGRRLHRYIYEEEHGALTPDIAVHHVDHDKSNNSIGNLQAMTHSEHMTHHGATMSDERRQAMRDNLTNVVRPFASEWHGSPEGRAWHKKHYEQTKDMLHAKETFKCRHCGKMYETSRKGFCTNACKSAWRRKQGFDDVTRFCVYCGKSFIVNKYKKTKTCSRACANRYVWQLKNG